MIISEHLSSFHIFDLLHKDLISLWSNHDFDLGYTSLGLKIAHLTNFKIHTYSITHSLTNLVSKPIINIVKH